MIRLDVAGAFHSPFMEPFVAPFRAALDEVEIGESSFTVYSCASAAPFTDVREELANALIRPVRWRETVIAMHEAGAPSFVEVGPGKVLARMGKRILKGVPFETPPKDLSMPSAALPPELHQIAREAARNGRRPAPPRTATIQGLGHYLPSEIVPNSEFESRIGVDDHWIVKRTGIHSRRRAAANEGTTDMAVFAARRALQDAGVQAADLDYVIVATMSADEITPNTAPRVAHAIGAEGAGAFDIGAACTGFLAGLQLAAGMIEVGRAERILLIGAEKLTRITDFNDKKTGMLFGDGAGAVVLGPSDCDAGIGPIDLTADGGLGDTIVATPEDPFIRMDGISTFRIAVKNLCESTVFAVAAAGLELDDIDLFVYHQANSRIIKAVGERLELDSAKVADYIAQLGNTTAASIPLTLRLSREDGRLRPGTRC